MKTKRTMSDEELLDRMNKLYDELVGNIAVLKYIYKRCGIKLEDNNNFDNKDIPSEPPSQEDIQECEEGDPHYPCEPRAWV